MTKKIFISYCHQDESFKNDLEKHLSSLKRQNLIDIWHDRCISAGEEWKSEIDINLHDSDIILFLISADFLASSYCMDIEAKQAMDQHKKGTSLLIPIIVRSVRWRLEELNKFQALPKDAKAISSYSDKDSAWCEVVEGIEKLLNNLKKNHTETILLEQSAIKGINPSFLADINKTDIQLSHRRIDNICLSDIFIYPDISILWESNEKSILTSIKSSKNILNSPNLSIIFGEEQQGKTSLLKQAYLDLVKKENYPLYLHAEEIKTSEIQSIISKPLKFQYINLSYDEYITLPNKIILIDDFHLCTLNNKAKDKLITSLQTYFQWIIITANDSFKYIVPDLQGLEEFNRYELKLFGHQRREDLIRKWTSLGVEESISEIELYDNVCDLSEKLKLVISNNIVPSKPIYLIIFLQMQEAATTQNLELSSYGHYYQHLIYQSFEKINIEKKNYDKYMNILSELAFFLYKEKQFLDDKKLDYFFKEYANQFILENPNDIIANLEKCSILTKFDEKITFKYPYIFYFFVGKKIADSLHDNDEEDAKIIFFQILEKLYKEDNANILIFITHHTKNSWVLNEINNYLMGLFNQNTPAKLTRIELGFMADFISKIPDLVLEQRNITKEREAYNKNLDNFDENSLDKELEKNEEFEEDLLSNINKSFKAMEIAGQIIRNRYATIKKDNLEDLANQGILTGLRFLNYFIELSDNFKTEIIEMIQKTLLEHPSLTNTEIGRNAESIYMEITYGIIYSTLQKIASSIGSKDAWEIYKVLKEKNPTPAYSLIYQAIDLRFNNRSLDIQALKETYDSIDTSPVCVRLLRELVIQHIYMFPVDFRKKQQLSSMLKLDVQKQTLMDKNKRSKA